MASADISLTAAVRTADIDKGVDRVKRKVKELDQTVDRSNQKRERQSKKSRGTSASMSILEGSRLIEDYSVAGMRGALNNIPGLAMSLGLGMGVAGAASIAAVAMMQLNKALNKVNESAEALARDRYFETFSNYVYDLQRSNALGQIEKQMEGIADAAKDVSTLGAGGWVLDILDKVGRAEKGASDFDLKIRGLKGDLTPSERLREEAKVIDAQTSRQLKGLDTLDERRRALEDEIAKAKEVQSGKEVKVLERRMAVAKAEKAQADELFAKGGKLPEFGAILNVLKFIDMSYANVKVTAKEAAKTAAEQAEARLKAQALELEGAKKRQAAQGAAIEQLGGALKDNKNSSDKLAESYNEGRTESGRKKIEADTREALAEEKRKNQLLDSLRMGPEGLLSSAGKVGFASKEATNSLNIQRSQTQYLKEIANNSKRFGVVAQPS